MPETVGSGVYRVRIRKEALKFSSAHMTVFADGTKENLHGHNYRTSVLIDTRASSLTEAVPFYLIKRAMRAICEQWDEKLLLGAQCPHFSIISEQGDDLEFKLCGKRYVVPRAEVELLPLDNIISETLASEFFRKLIASFDSSLLSKIIRLEVRIEEMLGQGASYIWMPTGDA